MKKITFLSFSFCLFTVITVASGQEWIPNPDAVIEDHHPFNFKIILTPQNTDTLDHLFWQISDMHSPFFGKHLTNSQIADLTALPAEKIQPIKTFLTTPTPTCPTTINPSLHHDYLYITTCISHLHTLFPTLNMTVYTSSSNPSNTIIRSSVPLSTIKNLQFLNMPSHLHELIVTVDGITDLPPQRRRFDPSGVPWLKTDKELTMDDMIENFGVEDGGGVEEGVLGEDDGQVRQGVLEFYHFGFAEGDLSGFQRRYGLPRNPVRKYVGSQNTSFNTTEATLDFETITAISGKVHTWDFLMDDRIDWVDAVEMIMTTPGAPKVISCSWGLWESDYDGDQIEIINRAFMKLGLAGFSFVIASGDSGPSFQPDCVKFDAEFPASSPYVISVGGAKIDAKTGFEGAWIHGGGGFSFWNPRPKFQDAKVGHYLQHAKLPDNPGNSIYNTTGRAYPDVAAYAAYQPLLLDGKWGTVSGTSASAPQFTAILALINIRRYELGLGPLGPITQTLYQLKNGVGVDVVEGMSYTTDRAKKCNGAYAPGFEAIEGWDAVTGLGTPKYDVLVDQLTQLP